MAPLRGGIVLVVVLTFSAVALAGVEVQSVEQFSPCSSSNLQLGDFQVKWISTNDCTESIGGYLEVTHNDRPGVPVISTRSTVKHAGHFIAVERRSTYLKQDGGGNFELVGEGVIGKCDKQSLNSFRAEEGKVVLAGTLGCSGASTSDALAYTMELAALNDDRLSYRVATRGSVGGEPGCLDPAVTGAASKKGDCPVMLLTYDSWKDEAIYGFGAQYTVLNHKGYVVPIMTREQGVGRGRQPLSFVLNFKDGNKGAAGDEHTSYTSMPTYMTNKQRGMYVTSPQYMEFDLRAPDTMTISLHGTSLAGAFLSANDGLELIRALTDFTGRMRPLPTWSTAGMVLGITGGTDRVMKSMERLKKFKHNDVLKALWMQDWTGLRTFTDFPRQGLWWNWELDRAHYHDWEAFRKRAKDDFGAEVMLYVNPHLATNITARGTPFKRDLYREASKAGYLVKDPKSGADWVGYQDNAMVDLTNPAAVDWFKKVIQKEMMDIGAAGWMSDFGECLPLASTLHSGERGYDVHSQYPLLWQQVNRDAVSERGKDSDILFFSRSASLQSPGVMSHLWLGDQLVTFDDKDGLASAVTGLMSSGLSGIPFVHSDIGGYTAVDLQGIAGLFLNHLRTKELFLRWCEFSAFSMMYRLHPGTVVADQWQFDSDDDTTEHTLRFAKVYQAWGSLRDRLAAAASEKGDPVFRPMFLNFYSDPSIHHRDLRHQYMIGDTLMVAPAISRGATHTAVHFPAGDDWINVWTNDIYGGGMQRRVPSPIGSPAVFFRKGDAEGEALAAAFQKI